MSHYKEEFPDFDDVLLIPEGYSDFSYHNDELPHSGKRMEMNIWNNGKGTKTEIEARIWQDYKDVEKREWGIDSPKFLFQITVDGEIIFNYGTDDRNEILKLAEGIEF